MTTPYPQPYQPQRPQSERIVTSAPMSFSGSARRIWLALDSNAGLQWGLGLPLIACAWMVVLCWYVFFGLLLVPYRLIRRGSRKRKLADARHREMLDEMRRYRA